MNILVNNCGNKDICDCKSMPNHLCSIKQAIVKCCEVKNSIPKSDSRTLMQMGKVILADEILEIFDAKITD